MRRKDEPLEAKERGEFVALLAHWWSHIELVKLCSCPVYSCQEVEVRMRRTVSVPKEG